jgi:hypothetical protein
MKLILLESSSTIDSTKRIVIEILNDLLFNSV